MSEWRAKRFWKLAEVAEADTGFTVQLDGRPVRTPAKTLLTLPTEALAEAVATEWNAQEEFIDPETMPYTRLANSALDKVATQFDAVADIIADYGSSDLLCYRAEGPDGLIARQRAAWDPVLDWARAQHGIALDTTEGVMPVEQSAEARARIRALTGAFSPFALTGFHEMVSLSGSWLVGFGTACGHMTVDDAWAMSRIDETWQIEQWGEDEEAAALEARKRAAFEIACHFQLNAGPIAP